LDEPRPEDFEALLRKFLAGEPLDPEQIAKAAGLPIDPQGLQEMIGQLSAAISSDSQTEGVNWQLVETQARQIAIQSTRPVPESVAKLIANSTAIGGLWLDEATEIVSLASEPKLLSRELWVADSLGLFKDLATPVADRMSDALTENFQENLPDEFAAFMNQASGLMKSAGSVVFAMQLGQALGKLSEEVLSAGDIGLPIFREPRAAFVAQNLSQFVLDFEEDADQVYFYLVIRELAHARLFKHSKWLREYTVNLITSYAREITIDSGAIVELSENFDPTEIGSIQKAVEAGALISPRTPSQLQALERIETVLALIEGWVDCVTQRATTRLPRSAAIAEIVRRKRSAGGPAEKTFLTLIGLELRPKKLREASALWNALTDEFGIKIRDAIWAHPDLMPSGEDIENPSLLIEKIRTQGPEDDIDAALRDLLS